MFVSEDIFNTTLQHDLITVEIPSNFVETRTAMIAVAISVFPNAGNNSDLVDLSFFDHGTY